MRRIAAALALAALLAGAGCSILPSGWHPFGTPISRAEKAEAKQVAAENKATEALQEEVHKTASAIDAAIAGNTFALPVAQQHARVARSLVDQVTGAPTVTEEQKWAELIARQTSLDEKVRAAADKESASRLRKIADLSADLEKTTARADEYKAKALQYANELQSFKDTVLKVAWVIGALFFLYFLGQILQFLAHFNPAFETASNLVNTFVSPALHSAAHKARKAAAAAASAVRE